mgnify:CR=1 FL=1
MVQTPARCGTVSGWGRHRDNGEKPCDACARAKSDYDARRREIPEQQLKSRIRAKAQFRAYQTLMRRYPEEYRWAYERQLILVRRELTMLNEAESESDS